MTHEMLYPVISKGMAISYWPMFFLCLWCIDKANEVKND